MTAKEEFEGETALTPEQRKMVDQLSETDKTEMDQALLSNASPDWCQVARIILTTMIELDNGRGLPKAYFAQRIGHLVREGVLESRGGAAGAPLSEVRLKGKSTGAKDARG